MRVREIDSDEGQLLLRIVRRGTGSVVTWRRAQLVLVSAQGMSVATIVEVTFTSADRVPQSEHAIVRGELITPVEIPALPRPFKSGYLKVRDRQSYEFALTSAAIALRIRGGVIREAKVAAGGVGTVPWKLPEVERHLVGGRPSESLWAAAAARAADGARPLRHNGFKVELLKRTVERRLRIVGGAK